MAEQHPSAWRRAELVAEVLRLRTVLASLGLEVKDVGVYDDAHTYDNASGMKPGFYPGSMPTAFQVVGVNNRRLIGMHMADVVDVAGVHLGDPETVFEVGDAIRVMSRLLRDSQAREARHQRAAGHHLGAIAKEQS